MKASEIDKILVRYYDGVTDEAEEKELKRFFTEEDVPAHLLARKKFSCNWVTSLNPKYRTGWNAG